MNIERPQSRQPIPENAKKVFRGVIFDVYQWEQELFDGTKGTFEKSKRRDTVIVFPVLPDGKVILTKQEQPGMKPFVGATGGAIDEGEDVLAAAKRELLEESGHTAEEFVLWDAQQPLSKIDWAVYTFVAKGLKKVTDLDLDAGEKIKLMPTTFDQLVDIATTNYENFYEKEVIVKFFEAKLDPKKMQELKELFKPLESK
jgi:ADP-ribose pyrophosphatase